MRRLDPARTGALGMLLALAACVTPPAPTVSLAGRACTERPVLDGALPIVLGGDSVTVALDDKSACWQPAGQAGSVYAAFRLPAADGYRLSVTSRPLGRGLFSPRVLLLGEQGEVAREVPRDAFLFRGEGLALNLRTHPGERLLIVASDPASVGQDLSRITSSVQTSATPLGGGVFILTRGTETSQSLTHALNGTITVSAEPLPKP